MRSHLPHWSCTRMAAPPTLCSTQREEALGTSPQSSVSSETLRCLGTRRARAARGTRCRMAAGALPRDTLPAHPSTLKGEVQHGQTRWVGKYSLRHCSQANMVPIQYRIILKVKIVYCCLCRNALNLHRLFSSFIWLLDYRHKKVTFTHLFSDITPFSLLLHSWYSPKPCWPTAPNLFYINTVNVSIGCSIVTKDLPK